MTHTITFKDDKMPLHKAAIELFNKGEIDIVKFWDVVIYESNYIKKQLLNKK